jgi:hypothetical protein
MSGSGHIVVLAVAFAASGCTVLPWSGPPPTPAVATGRPAPIDAAALEALYGAPHREDGTVLHGSHEGAQWTKWAKPDGSMELLAGHGLFADTGKFVIRGNAICTAWGHIDQGRENCVHLAHVGDNEYVTYDDDGSEGSRFKVMPP